MKPGRELDALVARHIFARFWTDLYWIDFNQCEWRHGDYQPYSTDIAAAWEVVEKMLRPDRDYSFSIQTNSAGKSGWFHCRFNGEFGGAAPTAPHAICLAALKAVGVEG